MSLIILTTGQNRVEFDELFKTVLLIGNCKVFAVEHCQKSKCKAQKELVKSIDIESVVTV